MFVESDCFNTPPAVFYFVPIEPLNNQKSLTRNFKAARSSYLKNHNERNISKYSRE